MHFLDPVAEAVHDKAERPRVRGIDRVSATGRVPVDAGFSGDVMVVAKIVETPEETGRAVDAGLAGVVVNDVKNYLHAFAVKGFHHIAEFRDGIAIGSVASFRSEEADRVVAPVVHQSPLDQKTIVEMMMYRE